jgi:prepilin-type N-terminal cleavage/methylation domain-containing protein
MLQRMPSPVKPTTCRAFTLIELLIVVAIISILAAIAVPNFLEAQIRAKVSRAKSDIRTVVTGLESYRVDGNGYPTYHYATGPTPTLEFHIGGEVPSFGVPDPLWDGRNPITTPVAYLTSMPKDPFVRIVPSAAQETQQYLYVNWDYAIERVNEPLKTTFREQLARYGSYRLHSRGPDTEGPNTGIPYDPTNGSVSAGDVTYGQASGFDKVF